MHIEIICTGDEVLTGKIVNTNYNTIAEARPQWIAEKRLNWLAQLADKRSAQFPDVPLLQELATDPLDKSVFRFLGLSRIPGKILITPPGVPAERVAALRKAFAAMVADPKFIADAKKRNVEVEPATGAAVKKAVDETFAVPMNVVEKARKIGGF